METQEFERRTRNQAYTVALFCVFVYALFEGFSPPDAPLYLQVIFSVCAVAVPYLLLRFVPVMRDTVREREAKPTVSRLLPALSLAPAFAALLYPLSALSLSLGEKLGIPPAVTVPDDGLLPALLASALLPAVIEELLCRDILLRTLSPLSRRGALYACAFLFSLMHISPVQIPYAFIAGLLLGALTLVSGSILPAILAHFLHNGVTILLTYRPDALLLCAILFSVLSVVGILYAFFSRTFRAECKRLFIKDEGVFRTALGVFTTPMVIFTALLFANVTLFIVEVYR